MFKEHPEQISKPDKHTEAQMELEITIKERSRLKEELNKLEDELIKNGRNIDDFKEQSRFYQKRIKGLEKRIMELEEILER